MADPVYHKACYKQKFIGRQKSVYIRSMLQKISILANCNNDNTTPKLLKSMLPRKKPMDCPFRIFSGEAFTDHDIIETDPILEIIGDRVK